MLKFYSQLKSYMHLNFCCSPGNQRDARWMETWDDDSLSSDSSSDITDVSPASSLSDFGAPAIILEPPQSQSLDAESDTGGVLNHSIETLQVPQLNRNNNTLPENKPSSSPVNVRRPTRPNKKIVRNPASDKCTRDNNTVESSNKSSSSYVANETSLALIADTAEDIELVEQIDNGDLQLLVHALGELEGGGKRPHNTRIPRARINFSFTPDKV